MKLNINTPTLDTISLNNYVIGDSRKLFKEMQNVEPFIDLIITSPPYWDMKQYGDVEEQIGFGQNYNSYLKDIKDIFTDVFNYSKDSATLYLNCDTMKREGKIVRLPDDIATELEKIGWVHQDTIIWNKVKTLPWSRKGQMRNVFEYILMFTKKGNENYKYHIDRIKSVDDLMEWWVDYPERYSPQGKVPTNIWEHVIPTQGSWGKKQEFGQEEFKHACPFPPDLMSKLILLSSDENDVVFDPFAGTGVLLAMAEKHKRRYLGFDTNKDYQKVFENVTKKLVAEEWKIINKKYEEQERKKQILVDTIYKLRVLKYPKALVKKIRGLHLKNLINISNNFSLILAFEDTITNSEENTALKKVNYIFVWKDQSTIDDAKIVINGLLSKSPFTKYGLQVSYVILNSEELNDFLTSLELDYTTLYAYEKGITTYFTKEIELNDYLEETIFPSLTINSIKDIPPIISNIRIQEDDYIEIERKLYVKR
jgi:DNA modification methylase